MYTKDIKQEEYGQLCCLLSKYKYDLGKNYERFNECCKEEIDKLIDSINNILSSKIIIINDTKEVKK